MAAYFLLTLAAQLTTLPLMAYYFKRISLTALIANPLILPAQPPLMVLGGLSVITGLVFPPVGQLMAWVAWPFSAYTIRVVEWLAAIPHGSIPLSQVAFPLILLFYAILLTITFARSRLSQPTSQADSCCSTHDIRCGHSLGLESSIFCSRWLATCDHPGRGYG